MKSLFVTIALLALCACGFEPMHGRAYQERGNGAALAAIEVRTPGGILGELLRAEIEDAINPEYRYITPAYRLDVGLYEVDMPLFVNPDGTSDRGEIRYTSNYTLVRLSDNSILAHGSLKRAGSYNSSQTADYAAYVSREDAKRRTIIELGQDYKLRLANLSSKL